MVEDAGGDAVAADARDVNTQLQAEMIKQQRKTNALLRARTQTVSASLAPARTRTRLVQQQQHHARSGGSHLKNETPPITELNQQRASMNSPALATPCPLACPTRYEVWRPALELVLEPVLVAVQPRACPEHYTPPLPRRQGQLRRVDRRNHQVLQLNDWAAHMRLAHSYSEPIYVVTMRAHILLWQCGAAEAGGRSFEVDHLSHMGKCDLYYHHITVRKYHKRA